MPKNPLYFSLKTKPEFTPKTTQEGESYFLLALEEKQGLRLSLDNQVYALSEHHFSVYENFSHKAYVLSPIHYTATSESGIIVHAYFNEFGDYLASHVRRDNLEKSAVVIGETEQLALQDFIKLYTTPGLKLIFQQLIIAQDQARSRKDLALRKLEEESRKGTTSSAYRSLLAETITACDEYHQLEFYPVYAVKNFLQRHLNFLNGKKTPKKKKIAKPLEVLTAEQKDLLASSLVIESLPSSGSLVEKKPQSVKQLTTDSLADQEKSLYQQLAQCQANDLNAMLKITKQLDALKTLRNETLVQACIEGDQATVVRYLRQEDIILNLSLLSTCAYYNHPSLFAYLYKQNKFKQLIFCSPFLSAKPLKYAGVYSASPLSIAYQQKNLAFFMMLLNKYHYLPDDQDLVSGEALLNKTVTSADDIEYTRALLKAGANPNLIFSKETKRIVLNIDTLERKKTPEALLKNKGIFNRLADTSLHTAANSRNAEAVTLLLEYKADSSLRNNEACTPFGMAVYSKRLPLNKPIIEAFLKKGHQIDERQSELKNTGLYYACEYGNLVAAKMLLEFKANPCAKHKVKTLLHGCFVATPLSIAAYKGFTSLVSELLQHLISSIEIAYAMSQCTQKETQEILLEAYCRACNREAIQAHKEQKLEAAEKLYRQAIEGATSDNETHSVYYNLGTCLFQAGKLEDAREALNRCLALREKLLAQNSRKILTMGPLLVKAKARLEEITAQLAKPVMAL